MRELGDETDEKHDVEVDGDTKLDEKEQDYPTVESRHQRSAEQSGAWNSARKFVWHEICMHRSFATEIVPAEKTQQGVILGCSLVPTCVFNPHLLSLPTPTI